VSDLAGRERQEPNMEEIKPGQAARQEEFRRFAQEHVRPLAEQHDRTESLSADVIPALAKQGYLASFLPATWGGAAMDWVNYGALHEEIGRACSNVRSLLTVNDMAAFAIMRWGSPAMRTKWLPKLCTGDGTGALAVSEPNAGSDVGGVETTATAHGGGFLISGRKKWITFGQIARVYVVLTKIEGRPTTFLVEQDTPGLTVQPISGMLGTRGSMLALLTFADCWVPKDNMIGRPGFGTPVALSALGLGRYSVACGCLGITQASLDCCFEYAADTRRFGAALKDHQLIQQMVTDIMTDACAARLLCRLAGKMKDAQDQREIMQTFMAKYHASVGAMRAAEKAVQIHGANGCSLGFPVERLMRDAKVMEIIEGSSQIQQITIATMGFQEFERQRRKGEDNAVLLKRPA
jgi:glutaryl-CoA dehydrogenase (non-decarboxylating)